MHHSPNADVGIRSSFFPEVVHLSFHLWDLLGASSECKKSWNFGYARRMQTSAIESTPEKWQNGSAGMFSLWRSWPRVAQLSGSSVGKKHVPRWIGGENSGKMIRNKHVFRFIIMKLHRCPKMLFMVFWGWNDWGYQVSATYFGCCRLQMKGASSQQKIQYWKTDWLVSFNIQGSKMTNVHQNYAIFSRVFPQTSSSMLLQIHLTTAAQDTLPLGISSVM